MLFCCEQAEIISDLKVNGNIDVGGSLSFKGIPMNTESSKTVALFYNITGTFRRRGNLVTVSFGRQIRTTSTTGEDIMTNEKVPSGYRPSYSHYFCNK